MAITYTEIFNSAWGDKHMTCFSLACDGSTTTVAGTSVGLTDIAYCWFMDAIDSNGDACLVTDWTATATGPFQAVTISTMSGTAVLFAVGAQYMGVQGPAYA